MISNDRWDFLCFSQWVTIDDGYFFFADGIIDKRYDVITDSLDDIVVSRQELGFHFTNDIVLRINSTYTSAMVEQRGFSFHVINSPFEENDGTRRNPLVWKEFYRGRLEWQIKHESGWKVSECLKFLV